VREGLRTASSIESVSRPVKVVLQADVEAAQHGHRPAGVGALSGGAHRTAAAMRASVSRSRRHRLLVGEAGLVQRIEDPAPPTGRR